MLLFKGCGECSK